MTKIIDLYPPLSPADQAALTDLVGPGHEVEFRAILGWWQHLIKQDSRRIRAQKYAHLSNGIYSHARQLARYLQLHPDAAFIATTRETIRAQLQKADVDTPTAMQQVVDDLVHELERIANVATSRRARHSPLEKMLWENAFRFWEKAGKKVGFSENGPLLRFLILAHRLCELAPPKPGTVKDATIAWKNFKRRAARISGKYDFVEL